MRSLSRSRTMQEYIIRLWLTVPVNLFRYPWVVVVNYFSPPCLVLSDQVHLKHLSQGNSIAFSWIITSAWTSSLISTLFLTLRWRRLLFLRSSSMMSSMRSVLSKHGWKKCSPWIALPHQCLLFIAISRTILHTKRHTCLSYRSAQVAYSFHFSHRCQTQIRDMDHCHG